MDATEVDKLIGELEIGIDRLRSLYEQYFMGFEKLEPTVPRKDVDRKIHALRKEQIRNTALRFRFQMVLQRYNTYQTHWQRVCREIENGTYKRHLSRAQRRLASEAPRAATPRAARSSRPPVAASSSDSAPPVFRPTPGALLPDDLAAELAELDREFAPPPSGAKPQASALAPAAPIGRRDVVPSPGPLRSAPEPQARAKAAEIAPAAPVPAPVPRPLPPRPRAAPPPARPAGAPPAAPPVPAPRAAARPASAAAGELPEDRIRQLYSQYLETRRRQKESTADPPFDAVAKNLRESGARLREKHGKAVDFEVTVKDGKTFLRPVVK